MINWYRFILLVGLLFIFTIEIVSAQGGDKKRTRAKLEYLRKVDNTVYLLANIKVREDRYLALKDASVIFYAVGDSTMIQLGELMTNADGDALLKIENMEDFYKDEDGYITFVVEYAGDDFTAEESDEIMIKRSNMDLSFFQKDSIKSINVNVYEIGEGGESIPIEDEEVNFYIKGTFSLLNFATETTDEDGNIIIDFPLDMPGDTAGILTIVTKVEESDDYGIIEAQQPINWGIPVPIQVQKHRGLGDTDAPLWMVYTLIILLSAVWFHYFYVIYLIIKIKFARTSFT